MVQVPVHVQSSSKDKHPFSFRTRLAKTFQDNFCCCCCGSLPFLVGGFTPKGKATVFAKGPGFCACLTLASRPRPRPHHH